MKYCPVCKSELLVRSIDGFDRSVCRAVACDFVYWNNPTAVVVALVQMGDEFIIARNSLWPEDQYSLISGYVDGNETLEQTAIREVFEELGLHAKVLSYIGSYSLAQDNQIIVAYWLLAHGTINLNEELADVKKLSKNKLKIYDFGKYEITRNIINDCLQLC